jgi:hypothetical protein
METKTLTQSFQKSQTELPTTGFDGLDSQSPRGEIQAEIARLEKLPQNERVQTRLEQLYLALETATEEGGRIQVIEAQ